MAARKAEELVKLGGESLEKYMKEKSISAGMTRREFRKAGGSREDWKMYRVMISSVGRLRSAANYYNNQAIKNGKVFERWEGNSPNIFKEVDGATSSVNGANVDFILFSSKTAMYFDGSEILGKNNIVYTGGATAPILTAKKNRFVCCIYNPVF